MNNIPSFEKALDGANAMFLFFVLGAVIVTANMNDIASLEKALDGANAMFLTTHYWEEKTKEKEIVKVRAKPIDSLPTIYIVLLR